MPLATQSDGGVRVAIARDPALVRTVRLVAAAVARRSDCPEPLIEEVRLAVGEACAVMIGVVESAPDSEEQVEILIDTGNGLSVTVTGRVAADDTWLADLGIDPWALLRGLSDDISVSQTGGQTTVKLTWPG
jgi:anti-sigma regulatory factor (Ser/Thr protein kinase)